MSEQILTDDEKSALLDGVSSGAVEVRGSGGARYASVRRYDVDARSRMVTNSYPRLQALDQRLAERLADAVQAIVPFSPEVAFTGLETRSWSECCRRMTEPAVLFPFTARPLEGSALVVLPAGLVRFLVESFFGSEAETAYNGGAAITPGERSVAARFCELILDSLREVWRPLIELAPQRSDTDLTLDLLDLARDSDAILANGFELAAGGQHGAFHILWPRDMLAPLLPAFAGRLRERSAAADAEWERAIRRRLADAPVTITTCIGNARHPVGDLAALSAGDVLGIEDPRDATVFAGRVPIVRGRFGVIGGRNAFEALSWLEPDDPHSPSLHKESNHGE